MKLKFNTILCALAVIAAAGCSKKMSPDPVLKDEAEDWVTDLSKPVPIRFGAAADGIQTRGGIIENVVAGLELGVLAVDVHAEGWWDNAGADQPRLFSEVATYTNDDPDPDATAQLKFAKDKYYPLVSDHDYSFFGFHTSDADQPVGEVRNVDGYNGWVVDLEVGKTDVLYGRALSTRCDDQPLEPIEVETGKFRHGFNAAYMRAARGLGEYESHLPRIDFDHLTAAIIFNFVLTDDSDPNDQLRVTDLKLDARSVDGDESTRFYHTATLYVSCQGEFADPAYTGIKSGSLIGNGNYAEPYYMKDWFGANGIVPVQRQADGLGTVIDPLFVVPFSPSADFKVTYEMQHYENGEWETYLSSPLTLPQPKDGKFEAGHKYVYDVIIRSFEKISIVGHINGYIDGEFEDGYGLDVDEL